MKEKYDFEITPEGKIISKNGAPMKDILIAYLKMKSPVIVLRLIVLFLVYLAITSDKTIIIRMSIILTALLSILLFYFVNKKPEQNIKKEGVF